MKHPYTWNHLILFAKLCESIDDNYSTTASWIKIVEDHHSSTFPFTLWPLTYRTSDITTSPSICSPILLQFPGLVCDIAVKIYVCNEVIIVCVQNDSLFEGHDSLCDSPCRMRKATADPTEKHSIFHHEDMSVPLLPCNVSRVYSSVKDDVLPHVYKAHTDSKGSIKSVICIGHGLSSSIASCLASDIGKSYDDEKEFLGLDEKLVGVDLVCFSSTPQASKGYWDATRGSIDMYLSVDTGGASGGKHPKVPILTTNPGCIHVVTGEKHKNRRSSSMLSIRSKFGGEKKNEEVTSIREIIFDMEKTIVPQLSQI